MAGFFLDILVVVVMKGLGIENSGQGFAWVSMARNGTEKFKAEEEQGKMEGRTQTEKDLAVRV